MKPASWLRIREVFEQIVDLPEAERAPFLDRACAGEAEVRAEVERMLDSDGRAASFLVQVSSVLQDTLLPPIGTRIGRYTLRRVIASGGMGTVFEAVQDEPHRTVALKTLRLGLSSPGRLQRFRFEAEVLGSLRHPSIAQIFEAGTHEERGEIVPFFAMELVPGAHDIASYVREQGLSLAERLRLFLEVCEAVQHGHQKGVIHRDLKPGNVLVDREGRVKVIDFGVARASDPAAAPREAATRTGQILGTLAYMAPEQLAGDPSILDVRSDVYALGVLLFELIEGRPPHETEGLAPAAALRTIQEEIPRPSSSTPRDLGWILLKALEKDPERRYPSVSELAADLHRFLGHEPVQAGPPSLAYSLTKLLRRHRLFLGATGVVIAALAFALTRSMASRRVEAEAREEAVREAHKLAVVNAFLEHILSSVDPRKQGRDALVIDALDEAARSLEEAAFEDPEVRATLHKMIAESYDNLGLFDRSESHLSVAKSLVEAHLPREHPLAIAVLSSWISHLQVAERNAEAEPLARETLVLAERVLGPAHDVTSAIRQNLAICLRNLGGVAEAESLLERELELLGQRHGPDHASRIEPTLALATVLFTRGALDESLSAFDEAERLCGARLHPDDHLARRVRLDHASALLGVDRSQEAAQLAREAFEWARGALGPRDRFTLTAMGTLARALTNTGAEGDALELEEARALLEEYCGLARQVYGEENLLLVSGLTQWATVLERLGRPVEAEAKALEALQVAGAFLPPEHRAGLMARSALGQALAAQGRWSEAEEAFRHVLQEFDRQFPPTDPRTLDLLHRLALALEEQGRHAEAIEIGEELQRRPGLER